MSRLIILAGLVVGLLGSVPGPAAVARDEVAAQDVTLQDVTVQDGRLRFTVAGLDRGSGAAALSGPIKLRVDGYAVAATAVVPQAQPQPRPRTSMLVIDTSGSMATGGLLDQAKAAAIAFLDAAPAGDRIGLIGFSARPALLAPPSAPRDAVRQAVLGLTAAGSTGLYDAVDLALSALGTEGDRQVLVISDGLDTASTLDLPGLLSHVSAGDARVDLVRIGAIATGPADPTHTAIAHAGRGQVFQAQSAADAAGVFREQASQRSTTVLVDAALPPGLVASTVRLQLSLPWGGRTVDVDVTTDLAVGAVLAAGPAGELAPEAASGRSFLVAGVSAVFAALVLLLVAVVAVPTLARDRRQVQKLVAAYDGTGGRPAPTGPSRGGLRSGALQLAGRVTAKRGIGDRLAVRLDRAAVRWQPNEWLLLCVGIGASVAVLGAFLGQPLTGVLLGLLFGALGPHLFLSVRGSRRRAAFLQDLPDALQLVASGLSSGYSLPQALDSVVRLGDGPVAAEVGRALAQSRLGVPVEDAIGDVADRLDSVDFHWVVMAIRVQREVGGSLASVLLQVAETIRERQWLRRHVKALSAEGRLSGVVLAALPVAIGGYMFAIRREYVGVLVTEPLGRVMLIAGILMLALGMAWMNKIAKVQL
jgi:tight adherence protein B